ncbi:MAG: hypothetical protein M0Z31_07755 [Clostridia bacterium]|nr:hypothetical protein [Clostridia bacterium]
MPIREDEKVFTQQAVVRVGLILASVLVVFFFARWLVTPESFGQYGRYRGDSIGEAAAREVSFAGDNTACKACHQEVFLAVSRNEHGKLNCQSCHGPAAKHANDTALEMPKVTGNAELCGPCHMETAGRNKRVATVKLQLHSGGVECTRCHDPHRPYGKLRG